MFSGKRVIQAAALAAAVVAGALLGAGCQYEMDLPPGTPSDLTVDQLVAKMSAATDPLGRYKNASAYILKQKVVESEKFDRDEYSLEIKFKKPDFMKYSSLRHGKPFSVLVFDGERAWNLDPATGHSTEVSGGTGMNLVRTFAALAKPGSTVKSVFKDVQIDMVDDEAGAKCYRLVCRVEDPAIAPYVILVGKDYLPKSFETVLYGADGSQLKYLSTTGKYSDLDNIKLATETTVQTGSHVVHSSLVSFTLDPSISSEEFERPVPWYEKAVPVEAPARAPQQP